MIVIQRVLHTDRFALVILRLVLTTPGLSRQGSSKVGHRTSHLEALRAFVSSSQNTKISWLIIPKYIKIPCAKSIMTSVHSHAMNLTEFHGTFGKANWEKLGKMGKNGEKLQFWNVLKWRQCLVHHLSLQATLQLSSGCFQIPLAAMHAVHLHCVSKISESRWDHGQLIDAQGNTLKIHNEIHHERRLKYHPYSAGSHVCTELGLPGQRIAWFLHRSPQISTYPYWAWPMAHGPSTGLWQTKKCILEIPWILAMWIVSWRPFL